MLCKCSKLAIEVKLLQQRRDSANADHHILLMAQAGSFRLAAWLCCKNNGR